MRRRWYPHYDEEPGNRRLSASVAELFAAPARAGVWDYVRFAPASASAAGGHPTI